MSPLLQLMDSLPEIQGPPQPPVKRIPLPVEMPKGLGMDAAFYSEYDALFPVPRRKEKP